MRRNDAPAPYAASQPVPKWVPALLALALAACGTPKPDVTSTLMVDKKGRQVTVYRICEKRGAPFLNDVACRTETVVHNYCYRSLGRVDCYEQPVAGRAESRVK